MAEQKNQIGDQATDELKPTGQTSYARIFTVSVFLGPFFLLGMVWLANQALPVAKADAFESFLYTTLTAVVSIFGGGTAVGGLARTFGKIVNQNAKEAPQSTPLQAGISSLPPQYQGYAGMAGALLNRDDEPENLSLLEIEESDDENGVQL